MNSQSLLLESFSDGWRIFKNNPSKIVIALIIANFLNGILRISRFFSNQTKFQILPSFISDTLAGFPFSSPLTIGLLIGLSIVSMALSVGFSKLLLGLIDNQNPTLSSVFGYFRPTLLAKIIWSYIKLGGLILLGLLLFGIPSIYWALKYQFVFYLIIDKQVNVTEAFVISGKITNGYKLYLLLISFVLGFIGFVGILGLGIGLLVTLPLATLTYLVIYRTLYNQYVLANSNTLESTNIA